MVIMSEKIPQLCARYGLRPSRQYGQNFLLDEAVLDKIIAAAELSKNDAVVEIGPGFGALTFKLAEKAGQVLAFEIEKKIKPFWEENLKKRPNVDIVWGDALREFSKINLKNYKVVANLPYQITSRVIRFFLEAKNPPELAVFTVQKEVAERICAKPGQMSVLSVAVQYSAEPEIIVIAPRTSFWPEPKVDSAVIRLRFHPTSEGLSDSRDFFRLVKTGFANRRKMLIKNLAALVGKGKKGDLTDIFSRLGLSLTVRAQELSVEQWKKLAEILKNSAH